MFIIIFFFVVIYINASTTAAVINLPIAVLRLTIVIKNTEKKSDTQCYNVPLYILAKVRFSNVLFVQSMTLV